MIKPPIGDQDKADILNVDKKKSGIPLSVSVVMELLLAVHEKGLPFRFRAKGYSMTPAIRDGDVITVSPLKGFMPRRGDVVVFRHPEQPQMFIHRVLHAKANEYFIRGDNCPDSDGWIQAENILGRVSRVERQGKVRFWPNRSMQSSWAEFYLLFYPIWLLLRRLLVFGYRFIKNSFQKLGLF